jgi:hypothetical protein
MKDPIPIFNKNDILDAPLNDTTKNTIIKYFTDKSIHPTLLITFEELFSYVWQRIMKSEYKTELMRILEDQIKDSIDKCFIGRFNRLLSVLVGFYDDIKIEISDNSRIGAIILNIKEKYIDIDKIKEVSKKELLEAGYTEADIEPWLEAIE